MGKLFQSKPYILFLLTFSIFSIFLSYTIRTFYPYHFNPQNLFILDLIGFSFKFPSWAYYLFALGSFFLFFLIVQRLFLPQQRLYPLFIYVISPWFSYLTTFESFYIYLLFLVLLFTYGLILTKTKSDKLGILLTLLASFLIIYSSITTAIMFLLLSLGLVVSKLPDKKFTKTLLVFALVSYLPLSIIMINKAEALENIFQNQITIFANPGLLAESNRLQGDSKKQGYNFLAKLTENKYCYFGKSTLLKSSKHFVPSTYFTPQEKLLNFSFTPPFFLGFLLPFIYGLYLALKVPNLKKYLIVLPFLIIPSLLSQQAVNLNRLVIFGPVIVLLICFGMINLQHQGSQVKKIILIISLLAVLTQLLFTISDMNLREVLRYHKYNGDNYLNEVGRQ